MAVLMDSFKLFKDTKFTELCNSPVANTVIPPRFHLAISKRLEIDRALTGQNRKLPSKNCDQ